MNKKNLLFAILMCICLTLAGENAIPVQAAEGETLKEGQWYEFFINEGETNEHFFEMPSKGYFYYEVVPLYYSYKGEKIDSGSWGIDTKMTVDYKTYENSRSYYGRGSWCSDNYSFKPGTKIKFSFNNNMVSGIPYYKMRITTKSPKNFETENNNSKSKADKIKTGITYSGILIKEDTDWYAFTAPETGKYKICAVNTEDDSTWDTPQAFPCIYDKGYKLLNSKSLQAGKGWQTLYSGTLKKSTKIYIKIPSFSSHSMDYKLKVKKI